MITGRAASIAYLDRVRAEITLRNQLAGAVRIIADAPVPVAHIAVPADPFGYGE